MRFQQLSNLPWFGADMSRCNIEGEKIMNTKKQIVTAPCPDCEHEVRLGQNPVQGEKFTCPNCWAYLELISIAPPELQWDVAIENTWEDEPLPEPDGY